MNTFGIIKGFNILEYQTICLLIITYFKPVQPFPFDKCMKRFDTCIIPWAVSYTHLDVYKRQILPIPISRTKLLIGKFCTLLLWIVMLTLVTWAGIFIVCGLYDACLLYTSAPPWRGFCRCGRHTGPGCTERRCDPGRLG